MDVLAGTVVLYLVEPYGAMIFILLSGFTLYDPAYTFYVVVALVVLGIVRRQIIAKE